MYQITKACALNNVPVKMLKKADVTDVSKKLNASHYKLFVKRLQKIFYSMKVK